MSGKVWLVGAGPGDPDLLTVKGRACLERCDAVVHDALASPALLALCPPRAARIDVGKRCGRHGATQEAIHAILVAEARAGRDVVRLKGGDPFVFGRGGEEALALRAAGVPFEVVPGVSAGVAVPAYAGIPVTHRGVAQAVTFVTGHPAQGAVDVRPWARAPGTLVVFMGLSGVGDIAAQLVSCGRAASTPAAVISRGTTPEQRTVTGTLATIAARVADAAIPAPAILVVGEVVALRDGCAWLGEVVPMIAPSAQPAASEPSAASA